MAGGRTIWYFTDGYLPEKIDQGPMEAHEALMLLNVGDTPAHALIDFYFEDRPPVKDVAVTIDPERVKTLRLDQGPSFGGPDLPVLTQYSLRIRSDVPLVAQFGRVDTTQACLAYYGTQGYWE